MIPKSRRCVAGLRLLAGILISCLVLRLTLRRRLRRRSTVLRVNGNGSVGKIENVDWNRRRTRRSR